MDFGDSFGEGETAGNRGIRNRITGRRQNLAHLRTKRVRRKRGERFRQRRRQ